MADREALEGQGTGSDPSAIRCPWCAAPAEPGATRCGACGAALAQRDSIDGIVIPGVTSVDQRLIDDAILSRARLTGQTRTITAIAGVTASAGLAAGAAVLGADYVRGLLGGAGVDLGRLGEPSEAARRAAERLDRTMAGPAAEAEGQVLPRTEGPGTEPGPAGGGAEAGTAEPGADGGAGAG